MKLNRLTQRIWVYPYEEERDRPNLSYIRGDRWSLAVDAGHSAEHTEEREAGGRRALLSSSRFPPIKIFGRRLPDGNPVV